MKIKITYDELLQMASNRFNCTVSEVVITNNTVGKNLVEWLTKALGQTTLSIHNENKIPAIKALRTIVEEKYKVRLGLAEAKWIIENWSRWIGVVTELNRLPKMEWVGQWGSDAKLS